MEKYNYKTTHTAKTSYNSKSSYLRPKIQLICAQTIEI